MSSEVKYEKIEASIKVAFDELQSRLDFANRQNVEWKEKLQRLNESAQSLVMGSFGYSNGELAKLTCEFIQKKFEELLEK